MIINYHKDNQDISCQLDGVCPIFYLIHSRRRKINLQTLQHNILYFRLRLRNLVVTTKSIHVYYVELMFRNIYFPQNLIF